MMSSRLFFPSLHLPTFFSYGFPSSLKSTLRLFSHDHYRNPVLSAEDQLLIKEIGSGVAQSDRRSISRAITLSTLHLSCTFFLSTLILTSNQLLIGGKWSPLRVRIALSLRDCYVSFMRHRPPDPFFDELESLVHLELERSPLSPIYHLPSMKPASYTH